MSAATARRVTKSSLVDERGYRSDHRMQDPLKIVPSRQRFVQAIGCLAYPVGIGIVAALALLIKSMV